ncbi:MAG TPA: hypothetical protein VF627_15485 [Abditibacterium sp.]
MKFSLSFPCFPASQHPKWSRLTRRGLGLLVLLALAGCGAGGGGESETTSVTSASATEGDSAPATTQAGAPTTASAPTSATARLIQLAAAVPRRIIYNVTVDLIADNFSASERDLLALVKVHRGYIAETNISGTPGTPRQGNGKFAFPNRNSPRSWLL